MPVSIHTFDLLNRKLCKFGFVTNLDSRAKLLVVCSVSCFDGPEIGKQNMWGTPCPAYCAELLALAQK